MSSFSFFFNELVLYIYLYKKFNGLSRLNKKNLKLISKNFKLVFFLFEFNIFVIFFYDFDISSKNHLKIINLIIFKTKKYFKNNFKNLLNCNVLAYKGTSCSINEGGQGLSS
jgi:hypothetical protein